MRCCCKAWCVGTGLVVAGLAAVGGWAMFHENPPPPVVQPQATAPRHATPSEVLTTSLERLHQEALAHFHADPKNGYLRMPPVYEKVVKEWKTPWFSPGELDTDVPLPFAKDMKRIHDGSVKDFLSPKASGAPPAEANAILWKPGAFDPKQKVWEAKSIDLIGLLKHDDPVVYVSERIKQGDADVTTRTLDEFELAGLTALDQGENLVGRSRDGVIRLVGAVRADQSCLACHRHKKEGDLLGAFSYVLREAEYKRVPFRPTPAPKN